MQRLSRQAARSQGSLNENRRYAIPSLLDPIRILDGMAEIFASSLSSRLTRDQLRVSHRRFRLTSAGRNPSICSCFSSHPVDRLRKYEQKNPTRLRFRYSKREKADRPSERRAGAWCAPSTGRHSFKALKGRATPISCPLVCSRRSLDAADSRT